MSESLGACLGIDLGTTNSAAALFDGESVAMVRTRNGGTLTPSVVRVDGRGGITVGARALRALETDPANTRAEFKRLMGTALPLEFPAAGLVLRPEELAAQVLKSIRADVSDQTGTEPASAVICVPALFDLPQSTATLEASRLAGFEKVELLQEPVASALAAGWSAECHDGDWLVYDLGGGTFDVSLLRTRDGLLSVVGHDGDNYLGGRDLDLAIVEWALETVARESGVRLSRGDPAHRTAIRKLKLAAEEAKVELSRASETQLVVPELWTEPGRGEISLDATLSRADLERMSSPIVDRTVEICRGLLAAHRIEAGAVARIVLVGGPTGMPLVRRRLAEALGAPVAAGLDPMTIVAQGAAIWARSRGLGLRAAAPVSESRPASENCALRLLFPSVSADLAPLVVGRASARESGLVAARIGLVRADGAWRSSEVPVGADGSFVLATLLLPRCPNLFRIEARAADGSTVPVTPSELTIVQGLTISDPPLPRTIGVALADGGVKTYFRRGDPLPARRTVVHETVQAVAAGSAGCLLRIPVVQGEFDTARLCRVVGTLEIRGGELAMTLPVGSSVEITLEVDCGGRLTATAFVPLARKVVSEVAHLAISSASPALLEASLASFREQLAALRTDAFAQGLRPLAGELARLEASVTSVARDVDAARGGDEDAGQKAQRGLLELDARLERAERELSWPVLEKRAREEVVNATRWVSELGTERESEYLGEAVAALEEARVARDAAETLRLLRHLGSLSDAAFFRHPEAWSWIFDHAASRVAEATDVVRAEALAEGARRARSRGDGEALRRATQQLQGLLPRAVERRRGGLDSGVR